MRVFSRARENAAGSRRRVSRTLANASRSTVACRDTSATRIASPMFPRRGRPRIRTSDAGRWIVYFQLCSTFDKEHLASLFDSSMDFIINRSRTERHSGDLLYALDLILARERNFWRTWTFRGKSSPVPSADYEAVAFY